MHLFLQLVLITYVNSTVSLIIPHICKKKYVVSSHFLHWKYYWWEKYILFSYGNFRIKSANSTHK